MRHQQYQSAKRALLKQLPFIRFLDNDFFEDTY